MTPLHSLDVWCWGQDQVKLDCSQVLRSMKVFESVTGTMVSESVAWIQTCLLKTVLVGLGLLENFIIFQLDLKPPTKALLAQGGDTGGRPVIWQSC